jgi:hypothetical protein
LERSEIGYVGGAVSVEEVEKWVMAKDTHISNFERHIHE